MLEKTTFPDNELRENWLKANVTIKELTLLDCSLAALSDRAFSSTIYRNTEKLHLLKNDISALRSATFRHLPRLQELSIVENEIKRAEKDLLTGVASTLRTLQLEKAIRDAEVLRNITGGTALPGLEILSLQYNSITTIDSNLFTGLTGIVSLYICESYVKTVCADAFEPISKSVKQLLMTRNHITTLPAGLFDSIIRQNPNFGLTIDSNPWHCDCDLEWMQIMIKAHPKVVKKTLICNSPERNADESFSDANFCDETTRVMSTTTSIPETSSTTEVITTIRVNCNVSDQPLYLKYAHQLSSTVSFDVQSFQNFFAKQLGDGSVLVNLPNLLDPVFLMWFPSNTRSNQSISCVGKVKGTFILPPLLERTSYTICSFNGYSLNFSPLNCLGLTTRSSQKVSRTIIISIFVASLMLTCIISAIIMYIAVRRHPATMLQGSKRVVIVKRKTLDAIVLPKGISSDVLICANRNAIPTISQSVKEDEYITPLPPTRDSIRKNSRSSASSTSYISGIEPTRSQLNSWRRKKSRYTNFWEIEPPPLPPHPQRNPRPQPLMMMTNLEQDEFVI